MALPTFFIIGAAKAGTTSLHHYLDQHPEIQMSANKEPNFFSGPANGIPYPHRGRIEHLDDYELLFDPGFAVRGEASTSYSNHPRRRGTPERIRDAVPEARFIYMVRDPIARAVSHYQHRVSWMGEGRTLEQALGDLDDPYNLCLCPGFYARQLERYLDCFPAETVMVVDQADLLAEREAVLARIFAFLSVDPDFDSEAFTTELLASSRRRVYPAGYMRLVEPLAKAAPVQLLPRSFRQGVRRSVERLLWPPVEAPRLEPELRSRLEELYAEDTNRLRTLTGEAFASWSI